MIAAGVAAGALCRPDLRFGEVIGGRRASLAGGARLPAGGARLPAGAARATAERGAPGRALLGRSMTATTGRRSAVDVPHLVEKVRRIVPTRPGAELVPLAAGRAVVGDI